MLLLFVDKERSKQIVKQNISDLENNFKNYSLLLIFTCIFLTLFDLLIIS